MHRTRNDYLYFQVALGQYIKAKKAIARLDKSITDGTLDELRERLEKVREEPKGSKIRNEVLKEVQSDPVFRSFPSYRASACVSVVFSAMCLEALINDYGSLNTSSSYYNRYLDGLSAVAKWFVVPKVVTGNSIDSDGQASELIAELFSNRNKLVHFKPKHIEVVDGYKALSDEMNREVRWSSDGIKAIREATKSLWELDSTFDYLEQYKPLWNDKAEPNISAVDFLIHSMLSEW